MRSRPSAGALAVLLATLAGAGAARAETATLTVWDWKSGDPATAPYYDSVKTDFEAAHPGVSVRFVPQPTDQYYTVLGTALAAQRGPDVVLLHGGSQAKERTGAMVRLDNDLGELRGQVKGFAEFTGADGGIYAVPISIQGFVVYYNRDLYRKAGLDPNAPPQDWATLQRDCAAIIASAHTPCFSLGNREGYGAEFFFSALAANGWTAQQQADWAAGRLAWSAPPVRAIVEQWVATAKAGWYPPGANSTPKFMDEYEGFERGETANAIGLISDVAHWKEFDEMLGAAKVGVYIMPPPVPAADSGGRLRMPFAGGIGYAVTRFSPHRDLAVALVRMLADARHMQTFFASAGAIAANTAVDTHDLTSATGRQILAWLAAGGVPIAHDNMSNAVTEEWHRQSQLLLGGGATVDQAVARLDQVRTAPKP